VTSLQLKNVFDGPAPRAIKLERAPLDLVLTQFRIPTLARFNDPNEVKESIDAMVKSLADSYPILDEQQGVEIILGAGGASTKPSSRVVVLADSTRPDGTWKVSVAQDAVSIFTTAYIDRGDYLTRNREVVAAVRTAFRNQTFARVGVRYLNRLSGKQDLEDIASITNSKAAPHAELDLPSGVERKIGMTELVFEYRGTRVVKTRFGFLPPRARLDPAVAEIDDQTWVLDSDSWQTDVPADVDSAISVVGELAEIDHRLFRWVVDEEAFMAKFGGNYLDEQSEE